MNKGVCIVAQNNTKFNYVLQACYLAQSIKKFSKDEKISIITNDKVPDEKIHLFDKIIPIENDLTEINEWRINNRKLIYKLTPYNRTIVFDTDVLVLCNLSNIWDELQDTKLYFSTEIVNHRGRKIIQDYKHRKVFLANNLPNIYSAFFYFEKNETNDNFFDNLELIVDNFDDFANIFTPKQKQEFCSIDVAAAMCVKLCNIKLDKNKFNLVHMKTPLQGVRNIQSWTESLMYYASADGIFINNYKQHQFLHYVEDNFINDDIKDWLDD